MHLLLALVAAIQTPARPSTSLPDSAHVVIVATTDVHGRVLGWDYVHDREAPGGLSRAATIVQTLRAQYPGEVVLVDAGDLLQGNPFAAYFAKDGRRRPSPIVDALNALQYDAATPGNHDFDFGLDLLQDAGADATYRYVCANVTRATSDTLLFAPFTVVQRGGVRIGITGFTTPGVMVWDRAQLAGKARVRPIAVAAPAALRQMAQAGVDLRVVLVHSGLGEPSSYDTTGVGPENDAAALASVDPKPDLVVFGHTHREVRDTIINGVHFVQPRSWALGLSVVHVWLARGGSGGGGGTPGWRITSLRADVIPLGTVAEPPGFTRRLASAHQRVRGWAATPLGTAGPGFEGRLGRAQDTPLLDFINEVQRRRSGAQLSAAADFDVDAGLPAGEIRLRDVAGIYPYENTLKALRISGQQLRDFLEQATRYYRTFRPGAAVIDPAVPGINFDVVSGVTYGIDLSQAVGQRIRGLAYQGRPVAPEDSFTLALNSFRAAGGGGFDMLKGARVVYDRGEDVRDLLIAEIRRTGALDARAWYTPSWSILPPARDAVLRSFAPAAPVVNEADSTLLRVVAITDFHGALAPRTWPWSDGRAVGGAAALKVWLDSLARSCGCTSIRVDGGDEMQGTPVSNFSWGRASIEALNTFGLDAAAIGNHEFDWSVDTLQARMKDAHYQFVSANITDSTGTARPEWADPWTLVQRNGVKVAVIGLTTTSTPTTTSPRNVQGLAFGDGAAAIRRELPRARAAANFVIVVAHEGAICDSGACHGEILDVARGLDSGSVDLIVAGHTHRLVSTVVNGIPIVEAGSSGNAVAVVDIVRAGSRGREVRVSIDTPYVDRVTPDPALTALVARYQRAVDSITSRPVATLRYALRREPGEGGEYPLGRLLADAYRNIGRADVALVNNGGIRTDLPAGRVTYGDLFAVTPFQNRLVRVAVPGVVLREALEHALAGGTPDAHVSGVEVWYDPRQPAGRRVQKVKLPNGRDLDPRATYSLAVPDFVADGGSGFAMLKTWPRTDTGLVDLDAVIAYLTVVRQPVDAPAEPRFHAAAGR
jgi:2',3'-cyclic-nucleotide 2'-phosphodiesterase/3'-nucleotidase/5'-nucleotidase